MQVLQAGASSTSAEDSNKVQEQEVEASSTNAEVFFSTDTTINLSFECEPFECVSIPPNVSILSLLLYSLVKYPSLLY